MSFVLNSASCVAAGRFNPAILVPDWIVKQGVLPDQEVEMVSAIGSGTTTFSMCGLQWSANLARLDVLADREGADPGDFVAKILERLEHTPTRAIGSNFQFGVTSPDERRKIYELAKFSLVGRLETATRSALGGTAIASFNYEDAVLRASLMFEGDLVHAVDFNFNRDSLTAGDGAIAARRWSSDKAEAQSLLRQLIGD